MKQYPKQMQDEPFRMLCRAKIGVMGIAQGKIALQLGITEANLSQKLWGTRKFTQEQKEKLIDILEVDYST